MGLEIMDYYSYYIARAAPFAPLSAFFQAALQHSLREASSISLRLRIPTIGCLKAEFLTDLRRLLPRALGAVLFKAVLGLFINPLI